MKNSNLFTIVCLHLFGSSHARLGGLFGGKRIEEECPPVQPMQNFDIESYVSKTWYVQQQAVTTYLPESNNFCVTADYTILDRPTFPWRYTIRVNNRAFDEQGQEFGGILYAARDGTPSQLEVAPGFLPRFLAGPYWILDYQEGEEGYALIIGGQPTVRTENGCSTNNRFITSSGGLWIFTRQATRNDELVETVRGKASAMGLDLTVLNDVDQTNCGY